MKKLIILIILAMTTVSCSLFDTEEWNEAKREDTERGRKCYKISSGYVYCKDKYENID